MFSDQTILFSSSVECQILFELSPRWTISLLNSAGEDLLFCPGITTFCDHAFVLLSYHECQMLFELFPKCTMWRTPAGPPTGPPKVDRAGDDLLFWPGIRMFSDHVAPSYHECQMSFELFPR